MKNIDERLEKIEKKIDSVAGASFPFIGGQVSQSGDEFDLHELWGVVWEGKLKIAFIVTLFTVVAVIYSLTRPNLYKSSMILAPAQAESGNGLGGLASQYAGLAAMAGINLGGGDNNRIQQAEKLMKSWAFLEAFWQQYDLKPQIMAVENWDKSKDKLNFDLNIYDSEKKEWMKGSNKLEHGESSEPSNYETFEKMSKMLNISLDSKSGLLTIEVEHYSPRVAFEWVELLKRQVNAFYQKQDMLEAQKNIDYLNAKIAETNVTDMHAVFYGMIESQTKTLMLAEVSDQYLIRTVVPAKIAEKKSKPRRAIICLLGALLGGIFGVMLILVNYFIGKQKK